MPANNYPSYRDTINRIGICLCIMLALIQGTSLAWALLSGWLSVILPAESAYFTGVLIETVSYLSYFIIPAVLFVPLSNGRERQPVRFDIRMPASFPLLILAGLAAISAAAQVNAWLMTLIGYTTDVTVSYAGGTDPQAIALFITVSLAPAFCEELLFRGVIYGNLRPYGVPLAVTVSALLFALMHGNIAQTFYTFVAGVVMALCYELSGSIWCSTFLHLFNNLSACADTACPTGRGRRDAPVRNRPFRYGGRHCGGAGITAVFPAPQTGSAPACTRQSFRKSAGVASSRTAHETGFSHCFP